MPTSCSSQTNLENETVCIQGKGREYQEGEEYQETEEECKSSKTWNCEQVHSCLV